MATRDAFERVKKASGGIPTLTPADFGITADTAAQAQAEAEKAYTPSAAMETLMRAQNANEGRLYQARAQQQRQYLNLMRQQAREAEEAMYQGPSKAFEALMAARQSEAGLGDPQNQARLY